MLVHLFLGVRVDLSLGGQEDPSLGVREGLSLGGGEGERASQEKEEPGGWVVLALVARVDVEDVTHRGVEEEKEAVEEGGLEWE